MHRAGSGTTPLDGRRLRERRLALGFTQGALGDHLGVRLNTIARWERGILGIDHPDWVAHQLASIEQHGKAPRAAHMNGKKLRERRERLGLTKAQLADKLGKTPHTVSRWERGQIRFGHAGWLDWRLGKIEAEKSESERAEAKGRARTRRSLKKSFSSEELAAIASSGPLSHAFPLRQDFLAQVMLPRDLKSAEAKRLAAFIATLAVDYSPRRR